MKTPEGRKFSAELLKPVPPRKAYVAELFLGTAPACDCGCGRRAGIMLCTRSTDGRPITLDSRAMVETLVRMLRVKAEKLWGPEPKGGA